MYDIYYKELPCQSCGKVWKWTLDKKEDDCKCPTGYGCSVIEKVTEKRDLHERLDILEKKLDQLCILIQQQMGVSK